ncbi:Pyruvate decarboxylase 1 [Tulasnella sp. 330]|nr:Pyruvate decarboxylase 1 [Tulasnella sp. 330]KAG8880406.1 Pyruvate decarboxylase 1 [Tulasnella sp. 331]KAG8886684.1 Pyruvate decarboxylase 1 [Tulasnella sp. 332]
MSTEKTVPVVTYLFKRLHELGIRSVHGVPGDFNLVALDYLPKAGLNWVGNCNELNAGYAADGYARIKGLSALITTFGVGELSALAAVGGACSEHVPIVHIVGVPSTKSQKSGALLHHTLGNGDFTVFSQMSRHISETMAFLNDPVTAGKEIDRALKACYTSSKPVYITLPTDVVTKEISAEALNTPIDLSLDPNNPEVEADVLETIVKELYSANKAVILVDACAVRHRVLDEVHELVDKSLLPVFVTPMSKSAIDETNPRFGGVYVGSVSRPDVKEVVESSDLIISMGALKSDFNSGSFTYHISTKHTVELHSNHVKIGYSIYPDIKMKHLLRKLIDTLDFKKLHHGSETSKAEPPQLSNEIGAEEAKADTEVISHAWFWPRVGQWLKPNDVIVTETGTSNFGILEARFPPGVTAISQVLWGSIGYSVGAAQGAALAAYEMDPSRRVILFVGDGSLQLTAQEIATMMRHKLKPIIFVINNEGYTIERLIHGVDAAYNDITAWKHTQLLETFGAKEGEYKNFVIKTRTEVNKLFEQDQEFSSAPYIQLVELFMPKLDAPRSLQVTARVTAERNAQM